MKKNENEAADGFLYITSGGKIASKDDHLGGIQSNLLCHSLIGFVVLCDAKNQNQGLLVYDGIQHANCTKPIFVIGTPPGATNSSIDVRNPLSPPS